MHSESYTRRLPVGAEVQPGGGIHFRVWAPDWKQVDVWLEPFHTGSPEQPQCVPMTAHSGGYFAAFVPQAKAGTRYRYRLGQENVYPDPASRCQPEGPHGPSQVVDPGAYAWRDGDWPGVTLAGQVIYELHVGTFTPEGTLRAAAQQLPELAALGITLVEIMPVAEFAGALRLGLRRRRSVRPFTALRHARRPPLLRRRGPRPWPGRAAWTSFTTTSVPWATTRALRQGLRQRASRDRLGTMP